MNRFSSAHSENGNLSEPSGSARDGTAAAALDEQSLVRFYMNLAGGTKPQGGNIRLGYSPVSYGQVKNLWNMLRNTVTRSIQRSDSPGTCQQILAHVGGMMLAFLRHRPIHFGFHWRGICRACLSAGLTRSKDARLSQSQAQ